MEKIKGNTLTSVSGNIYLPYFDWGKYTGAVYIYNPQLQQSSKLLLDYESVGIMMLMEYKAVSYTHLKLFGYFKLDAHHLCL